MAKLTDNDKKLLIADYHTNRYSQRELSKKYNTSIGTVNNLTKVITPKNEHILNAQITMLSAKSHLSDIEMNAILNTAQEEVFNMGLVTNASQLNLVQMTKHLNENKKLEKIGVGAGIQSMEEVGLGSSDYLNIQNAIDKAAITLKVADRHAPKTIIENSNNQQNILTVEIE